MVKCFEQNNQISPNILYTSTQGAESVDFCEKCESVFCGKLQFLWRYTTRSILIWDLFPTASNRRPP